LFNKAETDMLCSGRAPCRDSPSAWTVTTGAGARVSRRRPAPRLARAAPGSPRNRPAGGFEPLDASSGKLLATFAAGAREATALVGREEQMESALAALASARPPLVVIAGNPGAGKSALIGEVARARPPLRVVDLGVRAR
jgi:hypothetical protein